MSRKLRITLAAAALTLAAVSVAGSASASNRGFTGFPVWYYGGGFMYGSCC